MLLEPEIEVDIDQFPCACLVTTRDRKVAFANRYFADELAWDQDNLIGQSIETLFSRSSLLFCDSYITPMLLQESVCHEVQIYVLSAKGERVPMVANAKLMPNGSVSWVFIRAEKRNKLFHELETARETLEEQKEQLAQLSKTDSLTGVGNRRSFDENIGRMFAEADRTGQPIAVILMDIDHFKHINDTHGHDIGDRALGELGMALRGLCRDVDLVARHGGDEFGILLYDTHIDDAIFLSERIHAAVARLLVDTSPFTVSIGVSGRIGRPAASCSEVFKHADLALYDAKSGGRNQTAVRDSRRSSLMRA